MEKRNFLRTKYISRAFIKKNEERVTGDVINLSLNGAMVKPDSEAKFNLYDKIELELSITNGDTDIKINLRE